MTSQERRTPGGGGPFHHLHSQKSSNVVVHPLQQECRCLEVLSCSTTAGVVYVLLNRPERHNAINSEMWRELGSVFGKLGRMGDDCRLVVLAGNGPSFCSGLDVSDPSLLLVGETNGKRNDPARVGLSFVPQILDMQAAFTAVETCPVPVVAVIHGNCIGAGVDLMCCADIRWTISSHHATTAAATTTTTRMSVREVALGLAADVGTLQRFPKIVGNQSAVRELCLTGRNFDAEEALKLGLVNAVHPTIESLTDELEKLCVTICGHSPVAVQGTKKALLYARDHSVDDGLHQIAYFNALALQSEDVETSFKAKRSQRRPKYRSIPAHSRL